MVELFESPDVDVAEMYTRFIYTNHNSPCDKMQVIPWRFCLYITAICSRISMQQHRGNSFDRQEAMIDSILYLFSHISSNKEYGMYMMQIWLNSFNRFPHNKSGVVLHLMWQIESLLSWARDRLHQICGLAVTLIAYLKYGYVKGIFQKGKRRDRCLAQKWKKRMDGKTVNVLRDTIGSTALKFKVIKEHYLDAAERQMYQ